MMASKVERRAGVSPGSCRQNRARDMGAHVPDGVERAGAGGAVDEGAGGVVAAATGQGGALRQDGAVDVGPGRARDAAGVD